MPTGQYIRKPRLLKMRQPIYPIGPSIAYIPLTNGQFSLVDWDDAEILCLWNWTAALNRKDGTYYAARTLRKHDTNQCGKMHGMILNIRGREITPDHKNRNSLDNRRTNLRVSSVRQQSYNRGVRKESKSGIKGVQWREYIHKYAVSISIEGRRKHIGYLTAKEDAAQAYILAAYLYHGEFARIT